VITLHYSNAMTSFVGPEGLTDEALQGAIVRTGPLCERVAKERAAGKYPFADLPYAEEAIAKVERFAEERRAAFRNIVHLGIGGSALGPLALQSALRPRFYNMLGVKDREFCPRVFFLDNVDPEETRELLEFCAPKETLYHIVTKSGETVETVAAFMLAIDRLKRAAGDKFREHVVVTTGARGLLRSWADREKVATFDIPEGVGGRFSVFTPVGLLPAALMGVPLRQLMSGAEMVDAVCMRIDPKTNVAYLLALVAYLLDTSRRKTMHVVMPYARALRDVADWFRQLWAESLGKKHSVDGKVVMVGPTPVLALGATDQHSQIQLYTEGPNNKFVLFMAPDKWRHDETLPEGLLPELSWLAGKKLSELLEAERAGTEASLTSAGRPNAFLELQDLSPRSIGGLLHLLEMATVFAGHLYNVNPFDQPGVEHGKKAAFALLGRKGYEELRTKLESGRRDRTKYVVK